MMKSEFEKLAGARVEDYDYQVIEYVYTWHPVIDNVKGKQQIADLYKIGGMAVIKGMVDIAKQSERIERLIQEHQHAIDEHKDAMNALRSELLYLKDGDFRVNLDSVEVEHVSLS